MFYIENCVMFTACTVQGNILGKRSNSAPMLKTPMLKTLWKSENAENRGKHFLEFLKK